MDNHPILFIFIAFTVGALVTHGIWSRIARRRQKAIAAWAHLNFSEEGTFSQALSDRGVTRRNKVQQRVTVKAEHE